jgi:DNA-binding NarL/FixJ family response regulator
MDQLLEPLAEDLQSIGSTDGMQPLSLEALQPTLRRIEEQAMSLLREVVLLRKMMTNETNSLFSAQQDEQLEQVQSPVPTSIRLTRQEQRIVALVCTGAHNSEIALALGVAKATIHKHIQHIFRKCQAHTRTEMLYKLGWLEQCRTKR